MAASSGTPKPKTPAKPRASRSGNPATRARAVKEAAPVESVQVTSAKAWKKSAGGAGQFVDLPLPSGNVAKVRRITPEAFLTEKMIPDSLAPILHKAISEKKGLPPKAAQEMAQSPEKIAEALQLIDRAVAYAVVEPPVQTPPSDPSDRDENVLYTDEVDVTDKMFVFNWAVGGTADLERFRSELGDAVAGVSTGEDVEVSAL